MIGLCTDSNAQLPPELRDRFGVVVVPLTVAVDGQEFLEGVDIDADAFYRYFESGHTPSVSTSQPSPGQFALAYEQLVAQGCTEILSVHIGSTISGTLGSARLAARNCEVPVRLVDTATASFGISCCVWAAGDALAQGATLDDAATIAESLVPNIGNVFTVGALDLVRRSGRLSDGFEGAVGASSEGAPSTPVLSLQNGQVAVVGTAPDMTTAVTMMRDHVVRGDRPVKVAIGLADAHGSALSEALAAVLTGDPQVRGLVRYRIGASVGAHTGPGTAGAFFFPA